MKSRDSWSVATILVQDSIKAVVAMNHPEVVQATGSGLCETQLQSLAFVLIVQESRLVFNFVDADSSTGSNRS